MIAWPGPPTPKRLTGDSLRRARRYSMGMTNTRIPVAVLAGAWLLVVTGSLFGADVTGTWTASIDTQIGVQNYTYTFKIEDGKLTGVAKSQFGETKITDATVNGDEISFVENLDFQGQPLRIVYKGKISGDEIKFNRQVADVASEDFVAKRSK